MSPEVERTFHDDWHRLRSFDKEPIKLADCMVELPVAHKPTYPLRSSGDQHGYAATRCPAWTDRVLMTPKAEAMVRSVDTPIYTAPMEAADTFIGDHRPVILSFSRPS